MSKNEIYFFMSKNEIYSFVYYYLGIMNKIQPSLQCECNPGKTYRTQGTFHSHFQTQRHKLFNESKKKIDLYKRLQDTEILLFKTKEESEMWKEKYFQLKLHSEQEFYECM